MTQQTQQELIEQNVRMLLGDLQLQLIVARARIAELEQGSVPDPEARKDGTDYRVNGSGARPTVDAAPAGDQP